MCSISKDDNFHRYHGYQVYLDQVGPKNKTSIKIWDRFNIYLKFKPEWAWDIFEI